MPKLPQVGERLSLTIESLSFPHGQGVARLNQFVYFVPFAAPQEKVLAKVTQVKKTHAFAEIIEIKSPSPLRISAPCSYYMSCGGCSVQHIDYNMQVEQKKKVIHRYLQKINKDLELIFTPSKMPFRYRTRLQVHMQGGKLGFKARNSDVLIPIDDCLLAKEKLTQSFEKIKNQSKRDQKIDLFLDNEEQVHWINNDKNKSTAHFQQANEQLNAELRESVISMPDKLPAVPKMAYDLYCGSGNYTIPLARRYPETQVMGLDISQRLIDGALEKQQVWEKENRKSFENLQFRAQSINQFFENNPNTQDSMIIVNPPRTGLEKPICEYLNKSKPSQIVYVSCNPSTLFRDLGLLTNFSLSYIRGFDMFPQTMHMETLVLLTPNG